MKQTKQQAIPTRRMDDHTSQGIAFNYMEAENNSDEATLELQRNVIHRDEYYVFLFVDVANVLLTIDFEEIHPTTMQNTVLYIRPGQVHFGSFRRQIKGWSLAIDPMLVDEDYKKIFEQQFLTQRPIALDTSLASRMTRTAELLHTTMQAQSTAFGGGITLNLANAFIGVIAEQYGNQQETSQHHKSRSAQIAHQFKELLSRNYKTLKSPTQYANILNYSLSHLNESVKNVTGFPVSYWIQQQVILEAKRLLYYTAMDIKEIAFLLGYDDPTYFSRLFSKVEGVSPTAFRFKFRE